MIAKKKEDIAALREGCRRTARHLRILTAMVVPGATSRELEMKAREMVEKDGDTMAFYGYSGDKNVPPYESGLCCSVNDIIVHSPAGQNNARFENGDVVGGGFEPVFVASYNEKSYDFDVPNCHLSISPKLARNITDWVR